MSYKVKRKEAEAVEKAKKKEEEKVVTELEKSDYELQRLANIRSNQNKLDELGLGLGLGRKKGKGKVQRQSMELERFKKAYGLHVEVPRDVFPDEPPPTNGEFWCGVLVKELDLGGSDDVAIQSRWGKRMC